MTNSTSLPSDGFLASTADLAGLLAQFASESNRRTARNRRDAHLAQAAYSQFFPGTDSTDQRPVPSAIPTTPAPATKPMAVQTPISAEPKGVVSRIRRHQRCQCGSCQRCLDNARWDRIFNEKFADPTYYTRFHVRHNSTLAGTR